MSNIQSIGIYQKNVLVSEEGFSGIGVKDIRVSKGSRIVMGIVIENLVGTVSVTLNNELYNDKYVQVLDFPITSDGIYQKVYSDFHPGFRINYSCTGSCTIRIVMTAHDNSASTFIENANLLVDIDHTKGDSTQVGDGVEIIQVNPDGSINVQLAQNANPLHVNINGSVDTGVDGYGFVEIGSYNSTDDLTRIKAMHVHGGSNAQVRALIDGTEVRRADINPLTGIGTIVWDIPRALTNGQELSLEARVAPEIDGVIDFLSELNAFKVSS